MSVNAQRPRDANRLKCKRSLRREKKKVEGREKGKVQLIVSQMTFICSWKPEGPRGSDQEENIENRHGAPISTTVAP